MNQLAPRQGIFAVILLISFCLHLVALMLSSEKQQYDARSAKAEQIVQQLSQEAITALSNQDRISLSVLANRYQIDPDVARMVITDPSKHVLVQTGQTQTESGQIIEQPIIANSQVLGYANLTMKAVSKGELVASQWLFVLASAVLHAFLWLIYGYVARPTAAQLAQIGERVQQKMALARGLSPALDKPAPDATTTVYAPIHDGDTDEHTADDRARGGKTIQDYLNAQRNAQSQADSASKTAEPISSKPVTDLSAQAPVTTSTSGFAADPMHGQAVVLVQFYDEFNLLEHLAPEVATPYFALCQALLQRVVESFNPPKGALRRYANRVHISEVGTFDHNGATLQLTGDTNQLALASMLIGKLFIMLGQVVYEKHRELSRFALPVCVGAAGADQQADLARVLAKRSKANGLLVLFAAPMLRPLSSSVRLENLRQPTTPAEREAAFYQGLTADIMQALIHQRDAILTSHSEH
ncbi:hypothetical protein [Moraxella atlantae]|uniref:Histidine kinase BarA N-terminal domain-containing protein n=1 Tax=Faucicola atlantae TaxID=34059 RepID=A0A378Q187_9GAMM|nr:hypothetical protein [Moraxella atlantae]OPH36554.1 hypothetical protein B5J92_02930 [Moraxella atlantae]STY94435.1 Uncharacterised protein [Moraxella atlantae]